MAAFSMNLGQYAFYRERLVADGEPAPWSLTDLEEFARAHPGDPFAGRLIAGAAPKVSLQLEASGEPSVWAALAPSELDRWAGVLARMWARWGTSPGETIAFFEYGSSPLVLLASSGYVGYLRRGAAERLGLAAICNDGVATMAARMVSIVEMVRPSMLVLRGELAAPFAAALADAGVSLAGRIRWIAMSEVEGAATPAQRDHVARRLDVPVYRVLRCDPAYLIAGECPECGAFHLDREYRAQALPSGEVAVTARFAHLCPALHYNIGVAALSAPGCPLEPRAWRIEC